MQDKKNCHFCLRKTSLIVLISIALVLFCACFVTEGEDSPDAARPGSGAGSTYETAEEAPEGLDTESGKTTETESGRVTLIAVGDNLLHMPIVRWCSTDDGYDFSPLYGHVKDLVQAADMAFVNQEGPMGGDGFEPSDYPFFNAPQEAGLALAETGFTIVSQANNHGLDHGAEAVISTTDFWEQVEGVTMIGYNRSEQERRQIDVVEVRGVRFAWLAYSYGTNGMPMRDSYLMNLIGGAMASDIAAAREAADAVIVSVHWGDEYQFRPSKEQEELAQFFADQGVLLVIGHHPHVVQPLALLEGSGGNKTLVAYSLGNFISNQDKRDTMLEGMLSIVFTKDESGPAIESYGVIPLVMHYESGGGNYCVYPVSGYNSAIASRHYINQVDNSITPDWLDRTSKEIWGEYRILEK